MEYTARIMGYNVTFEKPQECHHCNKKTNLQILERIVDNTNGYLRYILVLKCPVCNEISFAIYNIGNESELPNIEKESVKHIIVVSNLL